MNETEINDALAQLKQLSEYPTPSTQYARVLRKYITSLVEALEKAATEPVAFIEHSKLEALSRGVGAVYVKNKPELARPVALYAASPALESRTVTVKLPKAISVLHRRDFIDAHRAIYAYPEAELNAALAAAGIQVIEGEGQ